MRLGAHLPSNPLGRTDVRETQPLGLLPNGDRFERTTSTGTCSAKPRSVRRSVNVQLQAQAPARELTDQIAKLFYWEQTQNNPYFEKPTHSVSMRMTAVAAARVRIETVDSPHLADVLSLFQTGDRINWPHHPLNTSPRVPFQNEPQSGTLDVHYSASRSMLRQINGKLFSPKAPTSTPHPLWPDLKASGKDDLSECDVAMARSRHIRSRDRILKPSEKLIVLTEIAAFIDKESGNAFSIRDLTPLQDGHYYLPAFSIPYFGREIAEQAGVDFAEFWGEHYAKAVGVAKAELFLRYGLQMETPNAQNWLIQLDADMRPTGVLAVRDLADSDFVMPFANHLGMTEATQREQDDGREFMWQLNLVRGNRKSNGSSFMNMETAGVTTAELDAWEAIQERGYVSWMSEQVGFDGQQHYTTWHLKQLFDRDEGAALLQKYAIGTLAPGAAPAQ